MKLNKELIRLNVLEIPVWDTSPKNISQDYMTTITHLFVIKNIFCLNDQFILFML